MNIEDLVASITPEVYKNLKHAVETGRWPNGITATPAQREHALQAVIAYDEVHRPQTERVGHIHTETHDHCGSSGSDATDEWQTIDIK